MRTAELPAIGTLNTTLPTPGDPTYQQEALALTIHKIIKELSDEDFILTQVETSDVTTWSGNMTDGIDDYIERYEDLLQTGASEVAASLPDVLTIMAAVMSGGAEPVLCILLNAVLDILARKFDVRADVANGEPSGGGTSVDMSEIEDKLDAIEAAILQILSEFSINLYEDGDAQTWTVGEVE